MAEDPKSKPAEKPAKLVKVKALCHLNEDGVHYAPGEIIETTPERAAALGPHVEKVLV